MSNYTPPSGGNLCSTSEPNPGDRIAGALSSLERTTVPGWLWALWVSSLPAGRRDPFAGAVPADVAVIPMGEGEGFDTSPPHYGVIAREVLPSYDGGPAKGPEAFAAHLVRMFSTAQAPTGCLCAACLSTGAPPGLIEYLAETMAGEVWWPPVGKDAATDPGASVRFTIGLEVAAARAMREHYIHALNTGKAPAGWHAQASDPAHRGHYMARMSDTGLAAAVCSVVWWEPMLEGGLPHLYPVEVYAALAAGFSYPVPMPDTPEWHAQAEAERRGEGMFYEVLRPTAEELACTLEDGRPPWDASGAGPCEVGP